jgi:metallo-beta-lactamase family protein
VLVDCGLFQGLKALRLRNWEPFPVAPASIDAVVLTHAHLDHSGYLPALVEHGFAGAVFATGDTARLSGIVLPDSGHLLEEEAAFANRVGYSKHRPALPLYTEEQARRASERFRPTEFGERVEVAPGVAATFAPAGHILGSAVVTLHLEGADRPVTFSGDLGRPDHPLLRPPPGRRRPRSWSSSRPMATASTSRPTRQSSDSATRWCAPCGVGARC